MYPFLKDKRALREQFRALRAESKSEARDTEIARRFFSSAFFLLFSKFFRLPFRQYRNRYAKNYSGNPNCG